ncbi:hypothetical protein [Pyrobaculum aerophilum]|uniref:hypothetical protein n=1 Tax=Pyrobaculum aerophilum TaxID=13773 RepID=UPI0015F25EEC|nr:hypothetical protein [Pyrobaculum aerophilum]
MASKFVGEAASIARFSPGAHQRVKEVAEDLSRISSLIVGGYGLATLHISPIY